MRRRVIYQALAWAPTLLVAGITTGEIFAATETSDYQAPKRQVQQQPLAQPPAAAPGDANVASGTTSFQIVNRTIIYEETTSPNFSIQPQANDQVAWHQLLTVPTRRIVSLNDHRATFPIQPQAKDIAAAWHRQLDLPTRRVVDVTNKPNLATFPIQAQANDRPSWYQSLSEPLRIKRSLYAQQTFGYANYTPVVGTGDATSLVGSTSHQLINRTIVYEPDAYTPFTPAAAAETITIDKWWRQLDLPVRRKTVTAEEGTIFGSPPRAEANDQIAWYRPLEAPTRAKRLPQSVIPGEVRNAFPQVPWGWYAELDKPTRLAKTPSNQISYSFIAAAPGSATTQQTWHQLDTPTRARRLYEFPATAIPVYFVPPTAGAGNEYNWWQQLDEPVRPRLSVKTAQQQGLAAPSQLITTTLEYAWFQKLNEPVRLKATFGQYPAVVQGNINVVVPYAHLPLHFPHRLKAPPNQSASAQGNIFPVVTALDYTSFVQIDGPQRLKPFNRSAFAQGNLNPVVPFARSWVDDPRRLRPRFNVSASAQGNLNPVVPFAHTFLYTPHRLKGRIDRPALAQGTINPATYLVGKFTQWWQQLDIPVREWRRVAWQHFISVPPTSVSFFVEGGPADEPERVICILAASRVAVEPALLREAIVPVTMRTATVPELLRVATVPETAHTCEGITAEVPTDMIEDFQDDAFQQDAFE